MEQIIKFRCEECGKMFDTKEDADKHEKTCSRKNTPIKVIYLNECNELGVITYPDAIYLKQENGKDKVNLMPKDRHEWCDYFYAASQFKFDQIKKGEYGELFIYTTNFSKEYEEDCFKRLIDFKMDDIEKEINMLKQNIILFKEKKLECCNDQNIKYQKNLFIEELDA